MPSNLISPRAEIATTAMIGPRARVAGGSVIFDRVVLGADVDIGPNVVFLSEAQPSVARDRVKVGANAVIYPGVVLGEDCCVRPGTVVTRSVPPCAIVEGNPASIVGYVETRADPRISAPMATAQPDPIQFTSVRGVALHTFPEISDLRGTLTVGEFQRQIPFVPLRYFMVSGVPSREVRGEHAHFECHQFLICISGSCAVVADDGECRIEVVLNSPTCGLYVPPMTWAVQYKYSADALLLVFASHHYDPADYIRDHGEFMQIVRNRR